MLFQERCDRSLFHFPLRDGQDYVDERLIEYLGLDAIEFQECQCGSRTDTLIPVNERMVLHQVVEVGRSHFEAIAVEVLLSKAGLRCGDR